MKNLVLFTLSIIAANFLHATDYYSVANGDWQNSSNWSLSSGGAGGAGIPINADNVFIESLISINDPSFITDITINSGGGLALNNVGTGYDVEITGDLTINATPVGLFIDQDIRLLFNGSTAQGIVLNQDVLITGLNGTLAVDNSNGVSVSGSGTLSLRGILAPISGIFSTNNALVLEATAPNSYARVALNDGAPINSRSIYSGTISGDVTMEHVFTNLISATPPVSGAYQGEWYQMSLPLEADLATGFTGMTLNFTGNPSTQNVYWFNSSGSGNNTGATQPVAATTREDAIGWTEGVGTDDQSHAYTMFLTNNAPFATSSTISLTGSANLDAVDFTSELNLTADPNRPLAVNVTDNPMGWNLLRNPWPSIIETETWFSTVAGGGVQADFWDLQYVAVHVWDSKTGQYTGWTISDFGTPAFSTIDYNTDGGVIAGFAAADRNIAPFQAFWVKTSEASIAAGGKVNLGKQFSETTFGNEVFHKTSSVLPETAVLFAYDQDSLKDITLVYYNTGMSNQFDMQGDIYKLGTIKPDAPSLFIEEGGQDAQSAGRPFMSIDTVEVFYKSSKNNTTAHLWLNDTNMSSTYSISLLDKITQQTQDLRANPTYTFTHNVNNNPNRFQLIITNSAFDVTENAPLVKPMDVYTINNELVIESKSYSGPAYFTMYDMAGRVVFSRQIDVTAGVQQRTYLPSLATALYSVEVEFDGKVMVEKLMK